MILALGKQITDGQLTNKDFPLKVGVDYIICNHVGITTKYIDR
jgi:hypothetical protein